MELWVVSRHSFSKDGRGVEPRIVDGPDEAHIRSIARREINKHNE